MTRLGEEVDATLEEASSRLKRAQASERQARHRQNREQQQEQQPADELEALQRRIQERGFDA